MALDSSLRRGETSGAQQDSDDVDEFIWTRPPATRSSGSISVTLWDEVTPAQPHTLPPLDDDSPER